MEYAIQLFLPVIGGLLLGNWLSETYGLSPIWTVILGVLGLAGGIGVLYKRSISGQDIPKFIPGPKKKPTAGKSVQELDSLYRRLHEEPPAEDDDFERQYPNLEKELKHDDEQSPPPKS